ncbi:MAG: hypothetical protein RL367_767 [Pseudomonadota bacterium]
MAANYQPLFKLHDTQRQASKPDELIMLLASAGTGKTQVLSARVLRLLLHGNRPEAILALTFTKAGAAEMAHRINERLAKWVMASDADIDRDLEALGEKPGAKLRDTARTSFASVLDARGGGLRIQTIHSFCQSLLGGFPAEAGLNPGFRLIDSREEAALPRAVLTELIENGDRDFLTQVQDLALDRGEGGIMAFLKSCARVADDLARLDGVNLYALVSRVLSGSLDIRAEVIGLCSNPLAVMPLLIDYMDEMNRWATPTGATRIDKMSDWMAGTPEQRADSTASLLRAWQTQAGTIYATPKTGTFQQLAADLDQWGVRLHEKAILAGQAEHFASALQVGRHFAMAYRAAKQAVGLVEYDDLIRRTAALLQTPGMGEWVRYKLDQGIDHILIDEAQDTNASQWEIVKALTEEFFSGEGAREDNDLRTVFAVGDTKQAIFGFQGTSPKNFTDARDYFRQRAESVDRELHDLALTRSFRTTRPVLRLVDEVISVVGGETMGVMDFIERHETAIGDCGAVTLLPPVTGEIEDEEAGEEDWASDTQRLLANRIADQLSGWLGDDRLWLTKQGRPLEPGDVLILLRSRGTIAQLIVARLHERGIPVAGLDRLALGAPLAVKDLLACVRFALQPLDDLNLACLLVSPLMGWDQVQLYQAAKQRGGNSLWSHLPEEPRARLLPILGAADMTAPSQFLEMILSGPLQGRKALLARLGEEARDPIDALINAALEFERSHPPSLQAFIDWFDRGEVEIKREAESSGNAVRVMTAHGAKGLQAPLVILADATRNPDSVTRTSLEMIVQPEGIKLPLFRPRKADRVGLLQVAADAADLAEREEHWRLLYVALTRAEERLVIAGALNARDKNGPHEQSWYAVVRQAMVNLAAGECDVPLWQGTALHYEVTGDQVVKQLPLFRDDRPARPRWLDEMAPDEERPARPLAPSALGPDDETSPPPSPALQAAAERGRLLHGLFERLPDVAPEHRAMVAEQWLRGAGGNAGAGLAAQAMAVIDNPAFAALFVPGALVEAPLAGIVDDMVIAGAVDRLLVSDTQVLVVDFKTGRRVPGQIDQAPISHLRQMSAYALLLRGIFPGRRVKAALLYTNGPVLMELTDALIEAHKPGLQGQQDNLGPAS